MATKRKRAKGKPKGKPRARRPKQAEATPETPSVPLPETRHESRPPR